MDPPLCLNVYHNLNYQRRSQTLQPMRSNMMQDPKHFMLQKFFESQYHYNTELDRAKYANVPVEQDHHLAMPMPRHHLPIRPHHVHHRSQSQHYYHNMSPINDTINYNNQYYNLSNTDTIKPARSRHLPTNIPNSMHPCNVAHLDDLTAMQVMGELGIHLDTEPPIPPSRKYTVSGSCNSGLFKISFPQYRVVNLEYTDPYTQVTIKPGETVTVLGYSNDDCSKFNVCYKDQHIEMPHKIWSRTCHQVWC